MTISSDVSSQAHRDYVEACRASISVAASNLGGKTPKELVGAMLSSGRPFEPYTSEGSKPRIALSEPRAAAKHALGESVMNFGGHPAGGADLRYLCN